MSWLLSVPLVLLLGVGEARADTMTGHFGFGWGASSSVGGLDQEFENSKFNMLLEGGLRLSRFELGATFLFGMNEPVDPSRHGRERVRLEVGPHAKVHFGPSTGLRTYLGLGFRRLWFSGARVIRDCGTSSVCDGGFYTDESGYKGNSLSAALGTEYVIPSAAKQRFLVALFAQVEYHQLWFKVVDERVSGGLVTMTLGFRYGGGRISR